MSSEKKGDKEKDEYLDFDVPVFLNKNNGQISLSLPKKKINALIGLNTKGKTIPHTLPIRILKWWK